jgi:hypothetical protein
VTHKLIFTMHFYCTAEPSRFVSLVVTPRGYKAGGRSCATYFFLHDLPPSPRLLPYAKKKERYINISKRKEGVVELSGRCLSFPAYPWQSRVGLRRRSHKSVGAHKMPISCANISSECVK